MYGPECKISRRREVEQSTVELAAAKAELERLALALPATRAAYAETVRRDLQCVLGIRVASDSKK